MRELTSHEHTTIANGLRIAAEKYAEHVKTMKEFKEVPETQRKRLADQFQRQHDDSVRLAAIFEDQPPTAMADCVRCANGQCGRNCADGALLQLLGHRS